MGTAKDASGHSGAARAPARAVTVHRGRGRVDEAAACGRSLRQREWCSSPAGPGVLGLTDTRHPEVICLSADQTVKTCLRAAWAKSRLHVRLHTCHRDPSVATNSPAPRVPSTFAH